MNWLWIKAKQGAWKIILASVAIIAMGVFLYNLIRPSEDRTKLLTETQTNIKTAIKEKDKIGAIKKIYDRKLGETKKIEDRDERLKALIRLHEELDL